MTLKKYQSLPMNVIIPNFSWVPCKECVRNVFECKGTFLNLATDYATSSRTASSSYVCVCACARACVCVFVHGFYGACSCYGLCARYRDSSVSVSAWGSYRFLSCNESSQIGTTESNRQPSMLERRALAIALTECIAQ